MKFYINENYFEFYPEEVKIFYMKECILQSFRLLPQSFFGECAFNKIYYSNDFVKIAIDEWIPFHSKILELFCGNHEITINFLKNMKMNLEKYEHKVDTLYECCLKKKCLKEIWVEEAFELYKLVNGYAILNFITPADMIKEILSNDDINLEDIIYPLVSPHRFIVQKKEAEIALLGSNAQVEEEIKRYMKSEYIYTKEFEWNFYAPYMDGIDFVKRKIHYTWHGYSEMDIRNEIMAIKVGRSRKLSEICKLVKKLYEKKDFSHYNKDVFNLTILIINIATQEEWRHMITSKFMYVLGKEGYYHDIDMSRMSVAKIAKYISL